MSRYSPHMRDPRIPPNLATVFIGFFTFGVCGFGVCGFGGVLRWARRMVVEHRRRLIAAAFTRSPNARTT